MANLHNHPASQPNMPAVARILSHYDRESLEAFLSVALDLLDAMDGDADGEDATDAEDDHVLSPMALAYGADVPGCAISEPDAVGYLEWQTRGSHKLNSAGGERLARDAYGNACHDDDEDDDPAEDDDSDCCLAGEDRIIGGSVADPDLFRPAHGIGDDTDDEDPDYAATVHGDAGT